MTALESSYSRQYNRKKPSYDVVKVNKTIETIRSFETIEEDLAEYF